VKLLIVGGDAAEADVARAGLPAGWEIESAALPGSGGHEADVSSVATTLTRERPDVIYTPALLPAGVVVAEALQRVAGGGPAWLSGVSGPDLMADYQRLDDSDWVNRALDRCDGLLPFSARTRKTLAKAGFGTKALAVATPPPALNMADVAGGGPAERGQICVDGRHGLLERGQVALAALRDVVHDLADWEVIVVGAPATTRHAAKLLAADSGLSVTVPPRDAGTFAEVLEAHARAAVSIHASLAPDVGTWEIAALAKGVALIVSAESDLAGDGQEDLVYRTVDPEDPTAIGAAVRHVIADRSLQDQARSANSAFARRHFAAGNAARDFSASVGAVLERSVTR